MAGLDAGTVKALLGLANDPSKDAFISAKIPVVIAAFKDWLGCDEDGTWTNWPLQQSFTEIYSGNQQRVLALRRRPVQKTPLPVVNLDNTAYFGAGPGAFGTSTQLVYGTDFTFEWDGGQSQQSRSGNLVRIGTFWPRVDRMFTPGTLSLDNGPAFGNIQVTYTAGWATVPQALCDALAKQIAFDMSAARTGQPLVSETQGRYSWTAAPRAQGQYPLIGSVQSILIRFGGREVNF